MSATRELLFGLIFNGAITAVIVTVAVVLGRKETSREVNASAEKWTEETIRRAS